MCPILICRPYYLWPNKVSMLSGSLRQYPAESGVQVVTWPLTAARLTIATDYKVAEQLVPRSVSSLSLVLVVVWDDDALPSTSADLGVCFTYSYYIYYSINLSSTALNYHDPQFNLLFWKLGTNKSSVRIVTC